MAEINDLNVVDDDNTTRWPEGMLASAVNNSARKDEGLLARWHKDTNASTTPGGTADVITVAANQTLSAYYDGLEIAFQASGTNTGAVTINVDGLGAKNLTKQVNVALAAGEIASGQKVICIYDGTQFQLMSAYLDASTAADAVATAADVVTTNADVVLTNADVVTTNADVVLTNADVATTNADVVLTNADVVSTGNDVTATNADVVTTTALAKTYSLSYTFSTTTAMADPGSGILRFNNATPASVTAIAIDDLDSDAADQSAYIISWDDSTSTNKGTLTVRQGDSFATFDITGLTDNSGWTELAVTYVTGAGSFSDATATYPAFTRTGDAGDGDVSGPASATDGAVAAYDGTTGKLLKDGVILGTVATLNTGTTTGLVPLVGTKSATETLAGLVEKSTSAENVTGTDDTVWPTVAGTKEMIDTHASAGALEYVTTLTASASATLAYTSMESGYDYIFVGDNLLPATDAVQIRTELGIAGPAYRTAGYVMQQNRVNGSGLTTLAGIKSTAHLDWILNDDVGSGAAEGVQRVELTLSDPANATPKTTYHGNCHWITSVANTGQSWLGGRYETAAEAHTSIKWYFSSGNITSGTIAVWRKKRSA